jgi:hypothetical protein
MDTKKIELMFAREQLIAMQDAAEEIAKQDPTLDARSIYIGMVVSEVSNRAPNLEV